jgi:hypothetical protein
LLLRQRLDTRLLPLTISLQALDAPSLPPPSYFKLNSPVRTLIVFVA